MSSACATSTPPKAAVNDSSAALAAIDRDLAIANADTKLGPAWSYLGAGTIAGVDYEYFRLGKGARCVISIDPSATAVVFHAAFRLPRVLDAAAARDWLEQERNTSAPTQRTLESKGALSTSGAAGELVSIRTRFFPDADVPALVDLHVARARVSTLAGGVFIASGAVDRKLILSALRRSLGAEGGQEPKREAAALPASINELTTVVPELRLSWPIESVDAKERVALEAIAQVLADGEGSRLERALITKQATSIRAAISSDQFELVIALNDIKTASATHSLIDAELRKIADTENNTISLARAQLESQLLRALSTVEDRAVLLGSIALRSEDPAALITRWKAIVALDATALGTSARRWLVPERAREVMTKPLPRKPQRRSK